MASVATSWSQEKVDLETTGRIRYEGFHNSKVMDYATGLMDSIGERLTGSPNMKRANEWTRDQLTAMGLSNSHLEAWGPFGRGWANQYVNVADDLARCRPAASSTPKPGLRARTGWCSGKCIRVTIDGQEGFRQIQRQARRHDRDTSGLMPEVKPITEAPYKRYSDEDLAKLSDYQIPGDRPPFRLADFREAPAVHQRLEPVLRRRKSPGRHRPQPPNFRRRHRVRPVGRILQDRAKPRPFLNSPWRRALDPHCAPAAAEERCRRSN